MLTGPLFQYAPQTQSLPLSLLHEELGEVKKIAVLRANGIGDFVFSLPALDALRLAYPQAEIVLLGLDWHADFLNGRPGPVDRVIVVPPARGVSYPEDWQDDDQALASFFDRMETEHFDLALQMHGGGRHSNPFVSHLGARLTAGLRAPDAEPLDLWIPYSYYQPEILRYLEVVSLVGARHASLTPRIEVTQEDLEEAGRVVPPDRRPLVVLHPGAGDPRRRWPAQKFAEVGNALALAGARIVIIGQEQEQEIDDAVVNAMITPVENICGQTSLNGLAGLLSRAKVVVSNDSGPLHLANAVGAATVGIYWCGNLITAGPVTRQRHRPAISWQLNCPVCGQNTTHGSCEHQVSFVSDVSKEEVMTSALELLELEKKPA